MGTQGDRFRKIRPYRGPITRKKRTTMKNGIPPFTVLHSNKQPVDNGTNASSDIERQSHWMEVDLKRAQKFLSPFQCGQAHDVQTGDALPPLRAIHLAALSPPRALDLVLVPLLVVVPDLYDRKRFGAVLLVRQQEERDAEDLRGGEDRVW